MKLLWQYSIVEPTSHIKSQIDPSSGRWDMVSLDFRQFQHYSWMSLVPPSASGSELMIYFWCIMVYMKYLSDFQWLILDLNNSVHKGIHKEVSWISRSSFIGNRSELEFFSAGKYFIMYSCILTLNVVIKTFWMPKFKWSSIWHSFHLPFFMDMDLMIDFKVINIVYFYMYLTTMYIPW